MNLNFDKQYFHMSKLNNTTTDGMALIRLNKNTDIKFSAHGFLE